jgi:DNA-binding transcriptional MerR regulator
VSVSAAYLNPSEAAGRLGISIKALRLYERRGLLMPARTAAGWRAYGPGEMSRAKQIVSLRELGFSLAQVARVLEGDPQGLEPALAAHQAALEAQLHQLGAAVEKIRGLRAGLAGGQTPSPGDLARLAGPAAGLYVAFDLPWPWGGERFEMHGVRPLNYITGPLGSGKTRLAVRLAEVLPGAVLLSLERLADNGAAARARLDNDHALKARVDRTLAWLIEDGATASWALTALLAGLEMEGPSMLVIDMLEEGLDTPTQEALIACLRRRGPGARPLFFLTRSTAILDLDSVGAAETIIFCPANHSPPQHVLPYPGSSGHEAVSSCLAPPDVRARTAGVIAWRPDAA